MKKGTDVIAVREAVLSMSKRDMPFTMCEHVTLGPPFLEKGVTFFDMSAVKSHTFQGKFSDRPRLRQNRAFVWPKGPGIDGRVVEMRTIGEEYKSSSDFSTHMTDNLKEEAWFSAVNPKAGVMLAYIWKRKDFPWLGNWEENYARRIQPWAGKSLTRGMEFTNTPFPVPLRDAVNMNNFQGQPTFRWLTAGGRVDIEYALTIRPVPETATAVTDVRRTKDGMEARVA